MNRRQQTQDQDQDQEYCRYRDAKQHPPTKVCVFIEITLAE